MTCKDVSGSEIVEKYLLGQLTDEVRDSFEQHYFECGRCFGLLQTFRDVQAELARTRADTLAEIPRRSWVWRWAWAPAMAVLFVAVSVSLWVRPPTPAPPAHTSPPSSAPPSTGPESPAPAPSPPAMPSLEQLARVEPPPYTPGRLRGAPDEATARFQEGMKLYVRGNHAAAVAGLQAASAVDPEAPHILFFLGISHLLTGQPDLAIRSLRQTIALGDSPYSEEAHFFLAKAHLQTGNVDAAVEELQRTIDRQGEREAEARRLLEQLRAVTSRSR